MVVPHDKEWLLEELGGRKNTLYIYSPAHAAPRVSMGQCPSGLLPTCSSLTGVEGPVDGHGIEDSGSDLFKGEMKRALGKH